MRLQSHVHTRDSHTEIDNESWRLDELKTGTEMCVKVAFKASSLFLLITHPKKLNTGQFMKFVWVGFKEFIKDASGMRPVMLSDMLISLNETGVCDSIGLLKQVFSFMPPATGMYGLWHSELTFKVTIGSFHVFKFYALIDPGNNPDLTTFMKKG